MTGTSRWHAADWVLTEPPRPQVVRESPRAPWLAVAVVCFGAFMGQLDASIVTLIFRPLEREFHAPLAAVQWVSLVYLLALVALLAPAGRIADAAGRKLIYGYGFVVFTVASAACGFAPSLGLLVLFRVVQAAGAAMLQSSSVALVTTSVPQNRMRFALGVQAGAQSLGLALGPTLGGLLTASTGWRAVFWINVPVGLVALLAGRYLLPRTRQFSPAGRFDWPGTALLATAAIALLLAVSAASGLSLGVPPGGTAGTALTVAVLAVVAALAAAGFTVRQRRAANPLIPPALVRSRAAAAGLAGAFAGYLALFGPLVLIPQVVGGSAGSEAGTGVMLSALPFGFGLAALSGDRVLPRSWDNRRRGLTGGMAGAAALIVLVFVPLTTAYIVPMLAVAGLGLGLFVPANNTVIMRSGPAGSAAVLGGMVNMARGVGTAFGIAAVALALHVGGYGSGRAGASGTAATAGAATAGPRLAFAILAAACAATAVLSLAEPAVPRGAAGSDGPGRAAETSDAAS
jgi:MFS family permease